MRHNTFVSALAAALFAAAAFPAAAQQPNTPSGKIAFVNSARVIAESRITRDAKKALERKFEKLAQQIEAGPKDQVERRMMVLDQDMNLEREDALRQYVDRTNRIIRRIAVADNLDIVFLEAAYFRSHVDITDKVIKELDAGR